MKPDIKRALEGKPFRNEAPPLAQYFRCKKCHEIMPEYMVEQHQKECKSRHGKQNA